jgi:hypothetical membrane protein
LGLGISLSSPPPNTFKAGVGMVVLFGVGIIFAGVFPEDYGSGVLHTSASALAFLFIISAQLLIWYGLKGIGNSNWGIYPKYSLSSGLLSIVFLILLRIAIADYNMYQGLAQRAFLAIPWIWIGITGLKLYLLSKEDNQI